MDEREHRHVWTDFGLAAEETDAVDGAAVRHAIEASLDLVDADVVEYVVGSSPAG